MTSHGWFQILLYFLLILALARPMGTYMTKVFERRGTLLDWLLAPLERALYRITGFNAQ